jgi:hypothetical protein
MHFFEIINTTALNYLSLISAFVPLTLGLIFFKSLDSNSRSMVVLLIFASMSSLAGHTLIIENQVWFFFNSYCLLDSVIWGYIFYRNSKNKTIRTTIIIFLLSEVFLASYLFYSIGIRSRFFTELVCLNSLLELLWVLSFFYERYKKDEILALEKEPMFWYCLGILVYAPTTYFLFVFYNTIMNSDSYKHLWTIHYLLNSLMYLIFSIGILTNILRTSKLSNAFSGYKS